MRGRTPSHKTVLIVEDVAITAVAVADALIDAGYTPLGPCCSSAHALALLEQVRPDYAVLDITLRECSSLEVAGELRRRDIPFLIYSGWAPLDPMPKELVGAPWLEKPFSFDTLVEGLEALGHLSRREAHAQSALPVCS
jgi:DNA-binding response OmpR family regulator